ncbi:MAG: hypothetical protein MZV65_52415 [Chromatiales bacterium]|nr:hypothetical protein [Chromatiales bacterium]
MADGGVPVRPPRPGRCSWCRRRSARRRRRRPSNFQQMFKWADNIFADSFK